jgi:hypothetical protein
LWIRLRWTSGRGEARPISTTEQVLLEDRFVMDDDRRYLANLLFDCDNPILNAPDVSYKGATSWSISQESIHKVEFG